jgi:hypothetical protein
MRSLVPLFLVLLALAGCAEEKRQAPTAEQFQAAEHLVDVMQRAQSIIEIRNVGGNTLADVTVGPTFWLLTFEQKKIAASACSIHAGQGLRWADLSFRDNMTGKEIATYDEYTGFKMK